MVDLVDRDSSLRAGATIPPFEFVDKAERARDRAAVAVDVITHRS